MRQLDLTSDLVELVHRNVSDPGPDGRFRDLTDEEFELFAAELIAAIDDEPIWLFAYGSLIWRPDFEYVESVPGRIHGWRRNYCLRDSRWRGSQSQPGLMVSHLAELGIHDTYLWTLQRLVASEIRSNYSAGQRPS